MLKDLRVMTKEVVDLVADVMIDVVAVTEEVVTTDVDVMIENNSFSIFN
jgi:hypothetical protein